MATSPPRGTPPPSPFPTSQDWADRTARLGQLADWTPIRAQCQIPVQMLDVRYAYGTWQWYITPIHGRGMTWVKESSLTPAGDTP